jgi:hypothetical protein
VSDAEQPARRAAELNGDDRLIVGRCHLAGLASACWTDCHSLEYQGAGPGFGERAVLIDGWRPSTM